MDGTARRVRLARSRLYLVLEARPHGQDPAGLLAAALRGGVDVVQLRDKELADGELVAAAEPFRRACDAYGALFVLNDRPDLVEPCGADGVHVGQGDASVADARSALGADRLIGLSASTPTELEAADLSDADYLGVGAVYSTPTKEEADAGGLQLLRTAAERLRVPWFAIGGVELDTLSAVIDAGAPGVAVVRAIRDAPDPEVAARTIRAALTLVEIDERTLAPGEVGARASVDVSHAVAFYVVEVSSSSASTTRPRACPPVPVSPRLPRCCTAAAIPAIPPRASSGSACADQRGASLAQSSPGRATAIAS